MPSAALNTCERRAKLTRKFLDTLLFFFTANPSPNPGAQPTAQGETLLAICPAFTMSATDDRKYDDLESESDSGDSLDAGHDNNAGDAIEEKPLKSALKKTTNSVIPDQTTPRPPLPPQTDPKDLDLASLTPLTPEIIARQATINIGTIGHVAHGKSTVVKAISGVQTVRFKNELIRNITIKLGYANAKIYKCDSPECPRPSCFKSFKSDKEVDPPCDRDGCSGTYRLLRHVS